ncbi:uncharacterized protein B0H18DRAFT_958840 [Fomitopsis serialis]|uniref:uncharacterized protein n=1 Tax=Fomitopsis serialis TaxID=139415 RepID=UPI002007421D|nr:uncharacterized protein B0H18DRAFT_958840 [Neoantrodia serialis]KAH9916431.1 hypothetical protein B0H18DRAFT_958840 [Neoantrodia serialis]
MMNGELRTGSPTSLHQHCASGINAVIVDDIMKPFDALHPLKHLLILAVEGHIHIDGNSICIPDCCSARKTWQDGTDQNRKLLHFMVVNGAEAAEEAPWPQRLTHAEARTPLLPLSPLSDLTPLPPKRCNNVASSPLSHLSTPSSPGVSDTASPPWPGPSATSSAGARPQQPEDQQLSDQIFMLVTIKEKDPRTMRLPCHSYGLEELWELLCPDGCVTGGYAYGDKVVVGKIKSYLMAFYPEDDYETLYYLRHGLLLAFVEKGLAMVICTDSDNLNLKEQAEFEKFLAHYRKTMGCIRQKMYKQTMAVSSMTGEHTKEELAMMAKVEVEHQVDWQHPPIPDPTECMLMVLQHGAQQLAEEQHNKHHVLPSKEHGRYTKALGQAIIDMFGLVKRRLLKGEYTEAKMEFKKARLSIHIPVPKVSPPRDLVSPSEMDVFAQLSTPRNSSEDECKDRKNNPSYLSPRPLQRSRSRKGQRAG